MDQNNNRPPEQDDKRPKSKLSLLLLSVMVILGISFIFSMVSDGQYTRTTFSEFMEAVVSPFSTSKNAPSQPTVDRSIKSTIVKILYIFSL